MRAEIEATYELIRGHVRRTPVIEISPADLGIDATGPLTLKLEYLQRSGSFKVRGAFANLLLRTVPEAGVVAASGGNHGVAVAFAAHQLKVKARVYVPTISDPAKIDRIRTLGATLVVGGERYADALAAAQEWQAQTNALDIHAFDQRETLLGQGSVALELMQQATVDTVLAPVGGGGLIGGMAAYLQGTIKTVGVETTGAPTLATALEHGAPTDAPAGGIAADALAPKRVGELMFPIAQRYVDRVVLVEDDAVKDAQRELWRALRIAVEPAASVGIAALRTGAYRPEPGERVAVVLSGANTKPVDE